MLNFSVDAKIFAYVPATDMRKGFKGLSAIIREEFQADPVDGSLFLFINKRRDRMKLLHFSDGGFWLYYRTELRQRDFSRKYANEIISWVKRCFKWAFQRRHISSGQYLSVDSIAPLTADEAPTKVVSCGSCHGCPRRL